MEGGFVDVLPLLAAAGVRPDAWLQQPRVAAVVLRLARQGVALPVRVCRDPAGVRVHPALCVALVGLSSDDASVPTEELVSRMDNAYEALRLRCDHSRRDVLLVCGAGPADYRLRVCNARHRAAAQRGRRVWLVAEAECSAVPTGARGVRGAVKDALTAAGACCVGHRVRTPASMGPDEFIAHTRRAALALGARWLTA